MFHLAVFFAHAALPLILFIITNERALRSLFSDSVLHLQGWKNDSALLCQTVDIFTGCLHSAESYFKTVVSEEPNARYFCCLWASTLLDTVGSLSFIISLSPVPVCPYTMFACLGNSCISCNSSFVSACLSAVLQCVYCWLCAMCVCMFMRVRVVTAYKLIEDLDIKTPHVRF